MAETKRSASKQGARKRPQPRSAEANESYLINLAMNLARKKLEDGTATSQLITHFLNLGTEKARLERERLIADTKVAVAKAEAMESQKRSEEIAKKAFEAFKSYAGTFASYKEEDDYDE